ncbi:LacI family DNA-binding transcriptional regulator [Oceanobacillus halophilus]|uniref:Catabolite control protein A n=1 Tax=Oceanobacillus halophilus TaxID=930130 RepID=A0A494ZSY4_9BACI|nr:LacI family DNA-binding transcriptional regulator [Oceanobacillus halophilus]RKQ28558.1 LacI family transcriptional regulator [Oceanobacillus halophilus]
MATTIRDVAKEAGVSAATVSRVLNNSGYAHEDTRKAVLDAIQKLNYRPNEVARSLYKQKSKLIGLILPDITNPFFPALARGVEDYLREHGYRLIIGNSDEQLEQEIDYLDTFAQHNVVGIVASINEPHSDMLSDLNVPIVLLDRTVEELPAVYADQFEGGRLAAEKMLERGSKEITIIRGPIEVRPVYQRFVSSFQVLRQAGVKVHVFDSKLSFEGASKSASSLFEFYPNTDGILACNDIVAVAMMNEAQRTGRKVPEDVQIIGFDDISISELVYPGLSTIRQPAYEMGEKAAEILLKKINQQVLDDLHCQLPVQFIERQSTRKVGE